MRHGLNTFERLYTPVTKMVNEGRTDADIFGKEETKRKLTGGRPQVNRDLARRLFEAKKYTTKQIADQLNCSEETVRRIRRQLKNMNVLPSDEEARRTPSFVELDFDQECKNATGISFLEYMGTKRKDPKRVFAFARRCWERLWDRPSLVRVMDPDDPLGDQIALKWNQEFADPTRSRDRKKNIRPLFEFLRRNDLNDKYFSMSQSRDPRAVKMIPEINSPKFPLLFQQCLDEMYKISDDYGAGIRFKLCTQMRTGKPKDERGFMGLRVGGEGKSYALINSNEDWYIHVLEKMGEEWDITWLPSEVIDEVRQVAKIRGAGNRLWDFNIDKFRKAWGEITLRIMGRKLDLHDLRKVSLTWFYVCGLPLEVATRLNVGWKDLSTADRHYINIGAMLRHSLREEYIRNIPTWFKDGLDDYIRRDPDKLAALLHAK